MTTDQIRFFENFLRKKNRYHSFYKCLSEVPLEMAYSSKDSYLIKVPAIFALSYGFFQCRKAANTTEGEWRFLRNEYIEEAAPTGILGDQFRDIDPKDIISAINLTFNGKQHKAGLKESEKYVRKVYDEAMRISSERTTQQDVSESLKLEEQLSIYHTIINRPALTPPEQTYTTSMLDSQLATERKKVRNTQAFAEIRKQMDKIAGAIRNDCSNGELSSAINRISTLTDYIGEGLEMYKEAETAFRQEWEVRKQEYAEKYEADLRDREAARIAIDTLRNSINQPKPEPEPEPEPAKPVEEVILFACSMTKHTGAARIPRRMASIRSGSSTFNITFNLEDSAFVNSRKLFTYDVSRIVDRIFIQFSETGSNKTSISNKNIRICNKSLVQFLLNHFGCDDKYAYIRLSAPAVSENSVKYELLSISTDPNS